MDECPRCQTPLERLSLGEVTTLACNNCGFADVPVDHESRPREYESWRDAFNRFYEE
ncbi:hypothetical protein [Natronosalvus amylolyticus]|uniref:hypothetical protein n=1 Tax=Natronosalvus amylolyticus TaxID=2961994 RepID=UPI0020C9BDB8|nr:hypothetical protein [Natronosalvus amylolyticus]